MRVAFTLALLVASAPAAGTGTLCMFDPPADAPVPPLEFLGREEVGPVLVHEKERLRSLPRGSWRMLHFAAKSARIEMVYRNPGDASLPPSFVLSGQRGSTRLIVHGRPYVGTLRCGHW